MINLGKDKKNILLPSKCCESRAIWLPFKILRITGTLFDKNIGKKLINE